MLSHLGYLILSSVLARLASASATTYYAYDGVGNNPIYTSWGSTGQAFLRQQVSAAIGYGETGDMTTYMLAKTPRQISSSLYLPSYRSRRRNANYKTDMLTYLGEFLIHDISRRVETVDLVENRIDLEIGQCDAKFNAEKCSDDSAPSRFILMLRSEATTSGGVRQQINSITAFLDGSSIYGSDPVTMDKLRAHYKGKLRTYNGELPKNTMGVSMDNPVKIEPDFELRAAGDSRANENPVLLALHSLFVREHNRLTDEIVKAHPSWTDEQIFQEARKWNVAFIQSICFYEYLPMVGVELPDYAGYRTSVNPGVDNFFATVASRYGMAEVNDIVARVDDQGMNIDDDYIHLMSAYYHPTYSLSTGIEPLLRGATFYRSAEVSPHFASSLQNYLFGTPYHGGSDLLAVSIQRQRDHGVPSYNEARSYLGLVKVHKFSDITSDIYLQRQLEEIYGSVDNVDPFIGGCAEDAYLDANFGQLFYASISDQFRRIRDGDRFYFENTDNGLFTADEIESIKRTGLRDIILRNTDIQTLPENIYIMNPLQPWPVLSQSETEESSPGSATTTAATETLRSGVYDIEWDIETISGDDYIKLNLKCETDGWVGIGIAKDESSAMVEADVIIAQFSGGSATVNDYWAQGFYKPTLDIALGGTNDVELISGSNVNGLTTIEFRRKIDTGDNFDRPISTTSTTPIIFAWHSTSQSLEYHSALRRGKTSIDFFAPLSSSTPMTPTSPSAPTSDGSTQSQAGSLVVDENKEFNFEWQTKMVDGSIWIESMLSVKISGPSWIGIGIESPLGGLSNADLIKVTTDGSGSCSIRDYWAESDTQINLDSSLGGSDDTIASFCYVSGGYLEFEFKRKLDTGDDFDLPFVQNAFTDVLFLYDDTKTMIDPSSMNQKHVRIDVVGGSWTGEAVPSSPSTESPTDTSNPSSDSTDDSSQDDEAAASTDEDTPTEPTVVSITGEVVLDESAGYTLSYELFREDIIFTLVLQGSGFAAIGFPGPAGGMIEADVIAAIADGSGGCIVGDYWSLSFVAPGEDTSTGGSNDLSDVDCSIDGSTLTATFKRGLVTGDTYDRDINPADINLIYAFSTAAGGLQYHGPTGRGTAEITPDLSVFEEADSTEEEPEKSKTTEEVVETSSAGSAAIGGIVLDRDFDVIHSNRGLFLSHIWLSAIGFGWFGVTALMLERFARSWENWKRAHYNSKMFSALCVFIAEIIALDRSEGSGDFGHCVLCYVILFLTVGQVVLTLYSSQGDRSVPSWRKLGKMADVFIYTLGFFQFWMALRLVGADVKAFHLFYAYASSVVAVLLFVRRSRDQNEQLPTIIETDQDGNLAESIFGSQKKSGYKDGFINQQTSDHEARRSSLITAQSPKIGTTVYSNPSTARSSSNKTIDEPGLITLTPSEFQENTTNGKCWTVIDDKIYEMEKFQKTHPGGQESIEDIIGKDGTELFNEAHEDSPTAKK